jgi:tRNA(Ile2) C34 agmatinyltransferase TiaS
MILIEKKKTVCPFCGYEWNCGAKTLNVTCPSCMKRFVPGWKKVKN